MKRKYLVFEELITQRAQRGVSYQSFHISIAKFGNYLKKTRKKIKNIIFNTILNYHNINFTIFAYLHILGGFYKLCRVDF